MPRLYKETRAVLNKFLTVDLGLLGYRQAYALQKRVVAARKAGAIEDVLLLCEHAHVITLGRNGKLENLLASEHVLRQKGVEFHATDRGGDITYHGPGQIVGYPILNLGAMSRKRTSRRGLPGIWVRCSDGRSRKYRGKNCLRSWSTPSRPPWFPHRNWSRG